MENKDNGKKAVSTGVSCGVVVAMIISYVNWHSIPWMFLHGFLSWFYVIYYIITYGWN
jgi:hypothetical protein